MLVLCRPGVAFFPSFIRIYASLPLEASQLSFARRFSLSFSPTLRECSNRAFVPRVGSSPSFLLRYPLIIVFFPPRFTYHGTKGTTTRARARVSFRGLFHPLARYNPHSLATFSRRVVIHALSTLFSNLILMYQEDAAAGRSASSLSRAGLRYERAKRKAPLSELSALSTAQLRSAAAVDHTRTQARYEAEKRTTNGGSVGTADLYN